MWVVRCWVARRCFLSWPPLKWYSGTCRLEILRITYIKKKYSLLHNNVCSLFSTLWHLLRVDGFLPQTHDPIDETFVVHLDLYLVVTGQPIDPMRVDVPTRNLSLINLYSLHQWCSVFGRRSQRTPSTWRSTSTSRTRTTYRSFATPRRTAPGNPHGPNIVL